MANEITKLTGDGKLNAELLFIYRGLTPITYTDQTGTVTVIPTPSAELPANASNILSAAEKAALDVGTDAYEIVYMPVPDAMSNADLLAEARTRYAKKKTDFITQLARKYNRTGQRFNEV